MTLDQISQINEFEFASFSYTKTCEVLDLIESIDLISINNIFLTENRGIIINMLYIMDGRVKHKPNYTPFYEIENDKNEKSLFILRVTNVLSNLTNWYLSTKENATKKQLDDYEKRADEIKENLDTIGNSFAEKKKELDEKINSLEQRITTNVLTIMGVFAAIITIIMSVVATSSSWLKDAQNASAILAFVIPSAVVVLSMSILLGFVFYQKEKSNVIKTITDFDTNEQTKKILKKSKFFFYLTIIFAVVAIGFSIVYSSINLSKTSVHSRYVLSQGMYVIKEVQNNENPENKSIIIEFEFNQKNYVFPYDESLIHSGKIFFCEDHNMLE